MFWRAVDFSCDGQNHKPVLYMQEAEHWLQGAYSHMQSLSMSPLIGGSSLVSRTGVLISPT